MTRRHRNMGGETPANALAVGKTELKRPGPSAAIAGARGVTLGARPGKSPAEALVRGATLATRKMNKGGYLGIESNDGRERVALNKERNIKLAVPHYKKGGSATKREHEAAHSLYKVLHSHFGGGSEPEMKKKGGGKMWIKEAINPENKGALHKSLHVPQDKKIPISKLHKAEHSKNPTLRKRAQLAETLRGFHHKPQGR